MVFARRLDPARPPTGGARRYWASPRDTLFNVGPDEALHRGQSGTVHVNTDKLYLPTKVLSGSGYGGSPVIVQNREQIKAGMPMLGI